MKNLKLYLTFCFLFGRIVSAQTVTIGTQVWMTKNLNVTTFLNGDPIPEAKTEREWEYAGDNHRPAWCYYNNDPANGAKYGKLYNWYAVNDPRGLAPEGYHIPSNDEWGILAKSHQDCISLKSTNGWQSYIWGGFTQKLDCPNCSDWNSEYRSKVACHVCKDTRKVEGKYIPKQTLSRNGNNKSGFSALGGGSCNGSFYDIGVEGCWWTSTECKKEWISYSIGYASRKAISYEISSYISEYGSATHKNTGCSVRCIKNKVSESSVNTQTQNNSEFVKSENMESKFKEFLKIKGTQLEKFYPSDSTGTDINGQNYYFDTITNTFEPYGQPTTQITEADIKAWDKYPCLKNYKIKKKANSNGEYTYKVIGYFDKSIYYFLDGSVITKYVDGREEKSYFEC